MALKPLIQSELLKNIIIDLHNIKDNNYISLCFPQSLDVLGNNLLRCDPLSGSGLFTFFCHRVCVRIVFMEVVKSSIGCWQILEMHRLLKNLNPF